MAISAREIVAVNPKPDSVFSFAAIINENDSNYRKRELTLTPAGTKPFMRSDFYPVIVLEKLQVQNAYYHFARNIPQLNAGSDISHDAPLLFAEVSSPTLMKLTGIFSQTIALVNTASV